MTLVVIIVGICVSGWVGSRELTIMYFIHVHCAVLFSVTVGLSLFLYMMYTILIIVITCNNSQ